MKSECNDEAKEKNQTYYDSGGGNRASRKSKSRSTRQNDLGQINIHPIRILNQLSERSPLLLAPLRRTHGRRHPLAEGPIAHVDELQAEVITARICLPTLERLEGSLDIFDRLKVHDGVRGVVPNSPSNDMTVETANALCSNAIEQIFDVLIHIRDVRLGGVMTEGVDIVDRDPGGRIGFVCVAGREEVDRGTRMTRSWNLELVPTFRLESGALESAIALLESATLGLGTLVDCRSHPHPHRPSSRTRCPQEE